MRQGINAEVAGYCERLDEAAQQVLERPDYSAQDLAYRHRLMDGMEVHYTAHACEEVDVKAGQAAHHQTTYAFVFNLPQKPGHCNQCRFSALYEHQAGELHGFQDGHPIELPQLRETDQLTSDEFRAYSALLATALWVYDNKVPGGEDNALRLPDQYKIYPDAIVHQSLTSAINGLLAQGGLFHHRSVDRVLLIGDAMTEVSIASNHLSGNLNHAEVRHIEAPSISVVIGVGGLSYQYSRRPNGSPELMIVQDVDEARYTVLDSFEGDYGEDGQLDGWTCTEAELDEKEQIEREMGFFVPRLDDMKFLLARVGLLLNAAAA